MKTNPVQQYLKQDEKKPFFRDPGIFPGDKSKPAVQTKLAVNTPGDAHEQEADAVADKVMRMPQTGSTPLLADQKQSVQRRPENGHEEDLMLTGEHDAAPQQRAAMGMDEEDNMRDGGVDLAPLQRKEQAGANSGGVSASFQQRLNSSKGGGNPLPDDVKQQMESGIGADFSNVRIHTGGHAAQLSSSIQAQAFTHGNDIYFNEGKYNPGSSSGKHLLAHELAHTVQQRAAEKRLQRQIDKDGTTPFSVTIPPDIKSMKEFLSYAELTIFHKVVNLNWIDKSGDIEKMFTDGKNHSGTSVRFTVHNSTLEQYRIGESKGEGKKTYQTLDGDVKHDITDEVNSRYYNATDIKPGTQIKKSEAGRAALWNSLLEDVMRDQSSLDKLPSYLKDFLQTYVSFTPGNYTRLLALAKRLKDCLPDDLAELKATLSIGMDDLTGLENAVDSYLATRSSEYNKERATIQKQRDAQMLVNDFEANSASTVWTKIPKANFVAELRNALIDPRTIDQSSTNLCGIAASCKAMIEYDPVSFTKLAIALYEKGSYSGMYANASLYNNVPTNGLNAMTYIVMASMRNSNNILLSYDPKTDSGAAGFTYPGDITAILEGYSNVKDISWDYSHDIAGLRSAIKDGALIIGLFDIDQLTKGAPNDDNLQSTFGNHYVQITNISTNGADMIVAYWNWGEAEDRLIKTTKDNYDKAIKNIFIFTADK